MHVCFLQFATHIYLPANNYLLDRFENDLCWFMYPYFELMHIKHNDFIKYLANVLTIDFESWRPVIPYDCKKNKEKKWK